MNDVGSIKEAQPTLKKDGCLADGSMMMPETAEGIAAFLDRRDPAWKQP